MSLASRPDLADSAMWLTLECAASRAHADLQKAAGRAWGGQAGPWISGIGQDHWPAAVKDELRRFCRWMNYCSDRAEQARPKRVHATTIHKLAREIASRDGAGFYGPQPNRHGAREGLAAYRKGNQQ